MTSPPEAQKYLSLAALPITALPDHPSLASHQTTSSTATTTAPPPASPQNLAAAILNEAHHFTTSILPDKFQVKGSGRKSAPSAALVDLLTADAPGGGNDKDTWFARRSYHSDKAEPGTASWDEFEQGLFKNHSENEQDYTPDCYDARQIVKWDFDKSENGESVGVEGWTDVGMAVYEMAHKIPPPLANRVFSLLIVRGKPTAHLSPREFVTAQVPVDLTKFDGAFYSNGRNRQEGASAVQKEKVIIGAYTSVERVRKLEDERIVWEMSLASDAKGWLPMSVQKMGVPAEVIKDVGFFIGWTDEQRKAAKT